MSREVLVTGACGLIGSHLVDRLLERGDRVVGFDDFSFGKIENVRHHLGNPRFRLERASILKPNALEKKGGRPSVVVHLAAVKKISEADPALPTLRVNAEGTAAVLEFARRRRTKIVIASTSDVYGRSPRIPFSEDGDLVTGSPTAKRWAYAVAKLYAEHTALAYQKDFGVPVVILRYFGCFSERSSTGWSGGHVPMFIDAILNGRPVTIHGNGRQTRSMAHVDDVVRGTILAMDSPKAVGQILNLGNDEEVSVFESAKIIHRIARTGRPLRVKFVPQKKVHGTYKEIARRVPDLRKAKKLLGYAPRVSFEEAVRRVIAYRRAAR